MLLNLPDDDARMVVSHRFEVVSTDRFRMLIRKRHPQWEQPMATVTKKELIDRIAEETGAKRVLVKRIVQGFLDNIIDELGNGNRLEFRDFGVFECKIRAARRAQNPKTLDPVDVPAKRTVKFKIGRLMKERLVGDGSPPPDILDDIGSPLGQDHSREA